MCGGTPFASAHECNAHYASVRHMQKENDWVRDTYAAMGIKSDKFLWNPRVLLGTRRKLQQQQQSSEGDPLRGWRDDQLANSTLAGEAIAAQR